MKKYFYLMAFLMCGMVFTNAQHERQNVLKTNPLGLLFGNFGLTYERAFTDNISAEVSAGISSVKATSGSEEVSANGFGFGAAFRYFFGSHGAPKGWNVTPQINYSSTSVDFTDEEDADITSLSFGATAGYQFVTTGGFVADLGLGIGMYNFDSSGNDNVSFSVDGIGPMARIGLGYAF